MWNSDEKATQGQGKHTIKQRVRGGIGSSRFSASRRRRSSGKLAACAPTQFAHTTEASDCWRGEAAR